MREVSENNFIDNSCLSKICEEWIKIDKVSLKIWLPKWTKKNKLAFNLHMRKEIPWKIITSVAIKGI